MCMTIIKRNGTEVQFNETKISNAINKAIVATGVTLEEVRAKMLQAATKDIMKKEDILDVATLVLTRTTTIDETCNVLADQVTKRLADKAKVEEIQDTVLEVLKDNGLDTVYEAYKKYREQRAAVRTVDVGKLITDYVGAINIDDKGNVLDIEERDDWRVKENATVQKNVGGLILNLAGSVVARYWLEEIYDQEIANAHRNADIHIHDLSMLTGYCAGWSLMQLMQWGITGPDGRIASAPAAHLSTLCNQMVNFLGIMQNEWAGAQAFSSFDTYLAAFVKKDNLTYKQTKQCIQSFIYGVNTPSRWGTQAPFTNITLDWTCPPDLKGKKAIVGGKEQDFCYGDCKKEMDMVNKAFLEIMIEGDANGRGFQYPIPTYSITRDFDWSDTENNQLLFEMTAKYGTPYFSNYVNSDMAPSDVRSMCCRLRLDLRELRKKSGGFFGAGESTGSIGVVTINMPRIAYLSKTPEEFYERLTKLMDISARSLKFKRNVIEKLMSMNMYPYTKAYLGSFNNHFSTIGLVGMNEACLNACWIKKDLSCKEAQDFTGEVLDFMRNRLSDYQEMYGDLYNLEATPAESTSYRFAKHDVQKYPGIITAGSKDGTPYYTNSSHLPVDYTEDIFAALDIQDKLQTKYTSGTVFHAFLGEKLPSWRSAAKLVKCISDNYKLPYYTLSPVYSICKDHGYLTGEQAKCPFCGKETEVYSRITGYYRPVKNWNAGKTAEFKQRTDYNLAHSRDMGLNSDMPIAPIKPVQDEEECESCAIPSSTAPAVETPATENTTEGIILVTTHTCPKCKALKAELDSKGIIYNEIYADEPEGRIFAEENGIMAAPTAIYSGKKYPNSTILKVLAS